MKIEEMVAGREVDALVAERVLGLEWTRGQGQYEAGFIDNDYILAGSAWTVEHEGVLTGDPVPYYSTDIAAAWEVVEKMEADGWDYGIYPYEVTFDRGAHFEEIGVWMDSFDDPVPRPLAICLAALKAVGYEVDDGHE